MGQRSLGRRWLLALLVLVLAGAAFWLIRDKSSELDRLRGELRAKGERLTAEELGLAPIQTNEAARAVLGAVGPVFLGMSRAEIVAFEGVPYQADLAEPPQVAWQHPALHSPLRRLLDWDQATALVDETEGDLAALHDVMKEPPLEGWDAALLLAGNPLERCPLAPVVQGLYEWTLVELHRGRLDAAHANLLTMVRSSRYHENDPTLLRQMMRVVFAGLTLDAAWQALRAEGWSEPQLSQLQAELQSVDLLKNLAEAFEYERVCFSEGMQRVRQGGLPYLDDLSRQYGLASVKGWKQRLYYYHWRHFRAAEAEMLTLRELQEEIDTYRELGKGRPWNQLSRRVPVRAGLPRFHEWLDRWASSGGQWTVLSSMSNGPNFTRAVFTAMNRTAQLRLGITALALERYRLAHGTLPEDLEALTPDYLEAIPVDPFRGLPVRFQRISDQLFALALAEPGVDGYQLAGEAPRWWAPEVPKWTPAAVDGVPLKGEDLLPLVIFEADPLMGVIQTLARHADMRMLIAPYVLEASYPPVEVRLENVSARAVLEAVLRNNNLRLAFDSNSGTYYVFY